MRVLFNCHVPFMLAHGGAQIQIEQAKSALEQIGVEVEPLRWWDPAQQGDILQHYGRIPLSLLRAAKNKGMKVVMFDLLTATGSRSKLRLRLESIAQRVVPPLLPEMVRAAFDSQSYPLADACLASTAWEAQLMNQLFGAPAERIHVVPNGVEEVFLKSRAVPRGQWLVCTATITPRKRVLEVAQAAVAAKTPLWVIGKPYSESDDYARQFLEFAGRNPDTIRYQGAVEDRVRLAELYREARGFVLLSTIETLSLSSFESAACGCPMLLSDLPWARSTFGNNATYCPVVSPERTAPILKQFYESAPQLSVPPTPPSWLDIAKQLRGIYESLLAD